MPTEVEISEFDLERLIRLCLERRIPVKIQYGPKATERGEGLVARDTPGVLAVRDTTGAFPEIDLKDIVKLEPQ